MKKLILIFFFPIITFSQTWKYSSGGNEFDGKYKSCSVQGKGSEYPYNNPTLVINKFEKDNDINFYISKAGHFQKGVNTSVKWVFNNEKGVIYSTYNFSFSNDGKIIFFEEFNSPKSSDKLSKYEFIQKLKNSSKVNVRASDKYGSNDLSFSLRGSTKAINYVISQEFLNEKIKQIQDKRDARKIVVAKQTKVLDKLLVILKNEKLSEVSLRGLQSDIKSDLSIGIIESEGRGYDIDSILLKPASSLFEDYGYVDVYYVFKNGVEKEIYGTWQIEMDAPIFQRLKDAKALKEKNLKKEKDRIKGLIAKYQIEPLKELIFENIIDEQKGYSIKKWKLNQVENVSIIISNYQYKKFWDMELIIHLNDNRSVKKNVYIYSIGLKKKQLKNIGGKDSVEF